ncbi:MAG: polysaccharide deacetylase family protein [Candidatus Hodarchaeota archaeon]
MVSLNRLMSWSQHLRVRRGGRIFIRAVKMFHLHMTPFPLLLQRIFDTLDDFDAKFTFPLVASIGHKHHSLTEWLRSYPHEIAIHGYKHVRYRYLSLEQQIIEFKKAIRIFKNLNIAFRGFRTPYNNYTHNTLELIEKFGFKWDGGIGFSLEHRHSNEFFKVPLKNGKESSYTCIPLCEWSDDRMIDNYCFSPNKIAQFLIYHLEKARKVNGLVMFDLHPIRIGQKKYIPSLEKLLDYATKIEAWVPTVSEAVDYYSKHHKWKGDAPVCCLLTGDIDNYTFFDYMRRF